MKLWWPLLLVVASSAALAQTEEKPKLLVLDLKTTGEVDDDTAQLVAELIAVNLSNIGSLEIFAGADVRRMMELEADKLATGCEDDGSCIADIAGALGARYVIYGRLGKLGSRFICTLNLFDADQGKAIQRENIKAADLDKLSDRLEVTLRELVSPLVKGPLPPPKTKPAGPKTTPTPNPKIETDPDAAMRATADSILLVGGATAGTAYACAALWGVTLLAGDDLSGIFPLIPVAGPVLYPLFDPTAFGFEIFCYSCAGVQAIGLGTMLVGKLLAPPPAPAPPVVAELGQGAADPRLAMAY